MQNKNNSEPRCTINGNNRHVGETFREGIFEWICLESGRWVSGNFNVCKLYNKLKNLIIGCFYQNETMDWVGLKIGEVKYNGLIRHTCDRYKDNPGLIQYHAEVIFCKIKQNQNLNAYYFK